MEDSECKAKTVEENKESVTSDGYQEEMQALTKGMEELQPRQAPKVFVGRNTHQSGNTYNFSRFRSHVKCCFNFGNQWPQQVKFPAQNQTCCKCGKANHFEMVCGNNTSRFTPRFTRQSYGSQALNHVDMTTSSQEFYVSQQPGSSRELFCSAQSKCGKEKLGVFRLYLKIEAHRLRQ